MLSRAMNDTGSTDPARVAAKLEGMQWPDLNGDVDTMRAEDHQLIQPLYSAVLDSRANGATRRWLRY